MAKITWSNDLLDELYRERTQNGRSLADLRALVFTKYGVQLTVARISQVLTAYKNQFNLVDKIDGEKIKHAD